MNFRQRAAWLCLMIYLGTSVALVYYVLDIADQYSVLSLEHSKLHLSGEVQSGRFWHHIIDIPFPILIVICLIVYFQIFAALFYCTLSHATSNVNKCLIPILGWMYLFQRLQSIFKTEENRKTNVDNSNSNHYTQVLNIS